MSSCGRSHLSPVSPDRTRSLEIPKSQVFIQSLLYVVSSEVWGVRCEEVKGDNSEVSLSLSLPEYFLTICRVLTEVGPASFRHSRQRLHSINSQEISGLKWSGAMWSLNIEITRREVRWGDGGSGGHVPSDDLAGLHSSQPQPDLSPGWSPSPALPRPAVCQTIY